MCSHLRNSPFPPAPERMLWAGSVLRAAGARKDRQDKHQKRAGYLRTEKCCEDYHKGGAGARRKPSLKKGHTQERNQLPKVLGGREGAAETRGGWGGQPRQDHRVQLQRRAG